MKPAGGAQRPALHAEQALVRAVLDGVYGAGSALPAERDLAPKLGVTRPTLREVMGRLERDGWVTVRHGRSTVVNDIWRRGGLGVISGILRSAHALPPGFVDNLLDFRSHTAPHYARLAVERSAEDVAALLEVRGALTEDPQGFAAYDWRFHYQLTVLSGNPIFTLILNGFECLYARMAKLYFHLPQARAASRNFYEGLWRAARRSNGAAAERVTRRAMQASIALWREADLKARSTPQKEKLARRSKQRGTAQSDTTPGGTV
jgi:GntR family negative regulator for fad regulon and positive regulator of fabA